MTRVTRIDRSLAELDRRAMGERYDRPMFTGQWQRGWFFGFVTATALWVVHTAARVLLGDTWSGVTTVAIVAVPALVLSPRAGRLRRGAGGSQVSVGDTKTQWVPTRE